MVHGHYFLHDLMVKCSCPLLQNKCIKHIDMPFKHIQLVYRSDKCKVYVWSLGKMRRDNSKAKLKECPMQVEEYRRMRLTKHVFQ